MKTTIFSRILLGLMLASVACFTISGCSSSTTPSTTTTTPSNVYPKQGSSYSYSKYQTDSSGNQVSGSQITVNAIVSDSGKSFSGQNNVYTITDDANDTTHYTYSGSNDVLTYIQNTGATGILAAVSDSVFHHWITLSISSHATGVVVIDSLPINIVVSSFPVAAKVHVVSNYIGSDSVRLSSGEALFVQHCQIVATASAALSATPLTNQRDIYFAPKIGVFAKETTTTIIPTVLTLKGSKTGTVQILTSYTLK